MTVLGTRKVFGDRLRWATEGLGVAWPSGSPLRDRPDLTVISGERRQVLKGLGSLSDAQPGTDEPNYNYISAIAE
jgi:hypothetical protein